MSIFSRLDSLTINLQELEPGFIDTGCYSLNLLLSGKLDGGVAKLGVTTLAGEPGFGKTFIMLSAVANFIKEGYKILWIDSEFALNRENLEKKGLTEAIERGDMKIVRSADLVRVETALVDLLTNLSTDEKLVIVIDSHSALVTKKLLEDAKQGKGNIDMGQASRARNEFIQVINALAGEKRVAIITSTHVYDATNEMYAQKKIKGGSGLKFFSNSIIQLTSKAKVKDLTNNSVYANVITAQAVKNRFAKELSKIQFKIDYEKGLDRYYGLVPYLLAADIIKKNGNRLELPDGRKLYEKQIYSPEILDPILADSENRRKIEQLFSYGSSKDVEVEEIDIDRQEEKEER